jgi:hypothetical protein
MARPTTFALGFAAAASLLLRAATGCGTSNTMGGSPDASGGANGADSGNDGGGIPLGCNGGCLCFAVDACPGGCFVSQTAHPDGSVSEPFCGNGIVECSPGGGSWSTGDMSNSCPVPDYPPVYLDGSAGAFCCERATGAPDGSGSVCAPDASAQVIMASSYDQTCAVDTDCVRVSQGNACDPCDFSCPNATIGSGALTKYTSDTSNLPAVLAVAHGACPEACVSAGGPCCRGGQCVMGSQCLVVTDAGTDGPTDGAGE